MSLSRDERRRLADLLMQGEDLPRDYEYVLFPPERRECELVYGDKERREDIIANVMAVPLQEASVFGDANSAWSNRLIFGDNLQSMKTLLEQKRAGHLTNADGTPGVRLIYIDPPFATKKEFRGKKDQVAYQDKLQGAQFIEFMRKRFIFLHELLSDDGSIFVHLDTKKSHYLKVVLDEIFGESNFRNEIIWKRQSAHNDSTKCGAIHDTILFYCKSNRWVWNEVLTKPSPDYIEQFFDEVEVETNRRYARGDLSAGGLTGGGYTYEFMGVTHTWRCPKPTMEQYHSDGRLHWPKKGVPRLKRYLDEFEGVSLQDIWNDLRVIHNRSPERVDYPTQKPEALVERIIRSSSRPGDIVLDAFAGSGTTTAVAEKLGRRWIGIDVGKLAIYTIQKRMLNLKKEIGQKGKRLHAKPFTVYNAGLYDFSRLRNLPWQDWRFFALKLFEAQDEPHTIGGMAMDGKRKGHSVLVFNHFENPVTEDTIPIDPGMVEDIHNRIGDKIDDRLYIVAPKGCFGWQQDYLQFGDVRYYALRIPYLVIQGLHLRGFTDLRQPNNEMAVNDLIETYGFDFIEPPVVGLRCGCGTQEGELIDHAYLEITSFETRGDATEANCGIENLSMLMLDFNYDTKPNQPVFDFDVAFYADELKHSNWKAWFPLEALGAQAMAVFIDVHGNESRVLIPRAEFSIPSDDNTTAGGAEVATTN